MNGDQELHLYEAHDSVYSVEINSIFLYAHGS